ncbi:MAG: twin-arginine translocase subunit TatC [Phycisphaerae bacterium]|nr:twin-arginine translocase subunit TatC [Phycisphaerae bacterium]
MSDDDEKQLDLDRQMSFGDHLEEFRQRLIHALIGLVVALVVCMVFGWWIFEFLKYPLVAAMTDRGEADKVEKLITLKVTGAILTYFRVCLYTALVMAGPWILYQFWRFIAVGLYPNERRYVHASVPFSAALFIGGALFFVFVVCKQMLAFLLMFGDWLGITEMITLDNHIKFMTNMMLVFGIGFQTPLVVFVLGKVGLVSLKTFRHYRRHVVLGILIFAALFTSPSPIDQFLLAIPMWLLYELGIFLVWWFVERKKLREDDDEEWD